MNRLFDVKTLENDSTKFIGRLKKSGFHRGNYEYISNNPNGVGTVYHLIKILYDKEVIEKRMDIKDFLVRINAIIQKNEMIGYESFYNIETEGTKTSEWMMNYYNSYIR